MKNKYYIKNLPNPIDLDDGMNKRYADTNYLKTVNYDNSSIVRNNVNTNFNNNTLTGLDSIYVNRDPTYNLELCTKQYTDTLFDDESISKKYSTYRFKRS